jgi:heat shock protein HspQ
MADKKAAARRAPTKVPAKAPTKAPTRTKRKSMRKAKFRIGEVVRHRYYPFRGIIFDVDPVFNSTDEWWQSIPEDIRPRKDQPFYHLLAENEKTEYIAYVSEQNLMTDETGAPLRHPQIPELFTEVDGRYQATFVRAH